MAEEIILENPELQMLLNNKETGYNYRERREQPWRENYTLYRDKVVINRLTQRQSVNLPLMKTTLRTLLKDVDDMPIIVFENLDNDEEAQVFQNEYWKWTLEQNNAEIQDIVDKKQDFFFGRTFDSWQVEDGRIRFDVEDPEDFLVDRYMNPHDIDSSRFLIHEHIFKPLSTLKNNPDYDQKEIEKLELFFKSQQGVIKADDNENSLQAKNQKMSDMGVPDMDDPVLGETYVELAIHYVKRPPQEYEGKKIDEQIWVYVEAENQSILMRKPQEMIIGTTEDNYWRTHYRYNSWGDDVDKQDFWTDGIADVVRTPNKVLNSWFSQLVENRTLRNFGMHYYDSTMKSDGFIPATFEPKPWGWYAVPGKPSDVLQKVDIPDLSESLDEMSYVTTMVEKATGSTTTQQGAQTDRKSTLGEVQLALGEAKSRTQGIAKFYTKCWEQRAYKFLKLIEAASDKLDAVKIYKKGKTSDKVYPMEISPNDWMTKSGYRVRVWSQNEKNAKDTEAIQKLNTIKFAMPDNPVVADVFSRKLLEFGDFKPDEVTAALDYEKKKRELLTLNNPMGDNGMTGEPSPNGQPGQQPGQPPVNPMQAQMA